MFKLIRSYSNAPYLYSPNSNDFLAIDEDVYSKLTTANGSVANCSDKQLQQSLLENDVRDDLPDFVDADTFITNSREQIKFFGKLTFGLTERCNLRCKYCIYSGNYDCERTHENKDMTIEIADKVLDYFMVQPEKPRYAIFYGGEALLNWPVLNHIVERIKRESPETRFSITSNGLLLQDIAIRDYLIANNFILNISFDGPQQENARVDVGGNGTYDRLMSNLQYIYDNHREYYKKNLVYNVTITAWHNLLETAQWFDTHPLFKDSVINVISMYDPGDVFVNMYDLKEQAKQLTNDYETLRQQYATDYKSAGNFLKGIYEQAMVKINMRPMGRPEALGLHCNCLPGVGSIFINSRGQINMCERAEHTVLGTVENIAAARDNIRPCISAYRELAEKHCRDCWAVRLCSRCFALVGRGLLTEEQFAGDCDRLRNSLQKQLSAFLTAKELNENAFDDVQLVDEDLLDKLEQ